METFFKNIWQRILGCFLVGVLAILPLVITVAVVIWVANFVEGYVGPDTTIGKALGGVGWNFADNKMTAYVGGWVVVLVVIFALGVVLQLGAKRVFQRLTEAIIGHIPLIGSIYGTTQQFVGLLDRKKDADIKGMTPVFCVFGGAHGTGVLALLVSPQKFQINGQTYNVVLVPTAPVPFGGGLLFIPTENVQTVEMTVDGLMSIYVSMGATTHQYLPE
jgi:uncharacterized membrane protein